ncbi:Rne/Rng family ribonuclease [Cetobacterium sp. SF1]|uniref:Rne/Rng family ribonuclease n=1 Tax=unclassified Cetobacterium TaxID=2630983 RepID=UPI003CE7CA9D
MKQIIINMDKFQTRGAILENGKVSEIFIERDGEGSINGNIYKGKVANVLPGMESAFVNMGLEKNGFLYVNDLREFEEKYLDGIENSNRPIEEILSVGDEVVVQVLSEPRGNKGARVTTHFTIPGKYLVLMPNNDHIAISKKIRNERERKRLEDIFKEIKPDGMGAIIRTACEGKSIYHFEKEIQYLVKKWEEIEKRIKKAKIGEVLYRDNSVLVRILRDIFSNDVDELIINDEEAYWEVIDYINAFNENNLKTKIKLYRESEDIFDVYNINKEIENALKETVWLDCGGYLVIEKTEALVSIDVNTGKNTGSVNLEETVVNTNIEAAIEIARQLRLRNLSGIIIIDFIDMKIDSDKDRVKEVLEQELDKDRIKSNIIHFTDLGLIEMTRKRTGNPLSYYYQQQCPMCSGTGVIKSTTAVLEEILKEIKEVLEEKDINIIRILTTKEVKTKLQEIYLDFINALLKRRGKTLIIEEDKSLEKNHYNILLGK